MTKTNSRGARRGSDRDLVHGIPAATPSYVGWDQAPALDGWYVHKSVFEALSPFRISRSLEAVMDLFRWTVRQAVTWRILAEIVRRHHAGRDLRVVEWHPLDGQYDGISLRVDRHASELGFFHVATQHIHSSGWSNLPRGHGLKFFGSERQDYVRAFLSAEDPKGVIDEVEQLLELPTGKSAPPTPAVVCMRVIAAFLSDHALERNTWDVRCGYHDTSWGNNVRDFAREFPAVRDRIASASGDSKREMIAAARVWRLASHTNDLSAESMNPRSVVLFDFATADIRIGSREESLWKRREAGTSTRELAHWLATQLGPGSQA